MKPKINSILMPSLIVLGLALSACQKPTTDDTATDQPKDSSAMNEPSDSADSDMTAMTQEGAKTAATNPVIAELSRYRWSLVDAQDGSKRAINELIIIKDQVALNFNQYHGQDSLNYSVGCNVMSAGYQLQNDTLMVKDAMSTEMFCEDLDAAENKLSEFMQRENQIKLDSTNADSPTLTLTAQDGSALIWSGRLTAQAKYNSKGETVFWAIAADNKPCQADSSKECLQVKPITYNDEGIKTGEGDWTEFAGMIDGYQHDPDNDEVVRLQRYKTDDKSAAKDGYAYVLDTVIEKSAKNADTN